MPLTPEQQEKVLCQVITKQKRMEFLTKMDTLIVFNSPSINTQLPLYRKQRIMSCLTNEGEFKANSELLFNLERTSNNLGESFYAALNEASDCKGHQMLLSYLQEALSRADASLQRRELAVPSTTSSGVSQLPDASRNRASQATGETVSLNEDCNRTSRPLKSERLSSQTESSQEEEPKYSVSISKATEETQNVKHTFVEQASNCMLESTTCHPDGDVNQSSTVSELIPPEKKQSPEINTPVEDVDSNRNTVKKAKSDKSKDMHFLLQSKSSNGADNVKHSQAISESGEEMSDSFVLQNSDVDRVFHHEESVEYLHEIENLKIPVKADNDLEVEDNMNHQTLVKDFMPSAQQCEISGDKCKEFFCVHEKQCLDDTKQDMDGRNTETAAVANDMDASKSCDDLDDSCFIEDSVNCPFEPRNSNAKDSQCLAVPNSEKVCSTENVDKKDEETKSVNVTDSHNSAETEHETDCKSPQGTESSRNSLIPRAVSFPPTSNHADTEHTSDVSLLPHARTQSENSIPVAVVAPNSRNTSLSASCIDASDSGLMGSFPNLSPNRKMKGIAGSF